MIRDALIWAIIFAAGMVVGALICRGASAHGIYTGLYNSKGQLCCGDNDCRPVQPKDFKQEPDARGEIKMSVRRDGRWIEIDPENILKDTPSPDGLVHACIVGVEARCVLMPQGN